MFPLFLSSYAESGADLAREAVLARDALNDVIAYFGKAPFPTTPWRWNFCGQSLRGRIQLQHGAPEQRTFYLELEHALTSKSTDSEKEAHRFNYAHHIAHSWIPKHTYGAGYFPFTWEMEPVIDTIWFNEGFGRYVAISALADALPEGDATRYRKESLIVCAGIVEAAPRSSSVCRWMTLARGIVYVPGDFRVGMNLFARGDDGRRNGRSHSRPNRRARNRCAMPCAT